MLISTDCLNNHSLSSLSCDKIEINNLQTQAKTKQCRVILAGWFVEASFISSSIAISWLNSWISILALIPTILEVHYNYNKYRQLLELSFQTKLRTYEKLHLWELRSCTYRKFRQLHQIKVQGLIEIVPLIMGRLIFFLQSRRYSHPLNPE